MDWPAEMHGMPGECLLRLSRANASLSSTWQHQPAFWVYVTLTMTVCYEACGLARHAQRLHLRPVSSNSRLAVSLAREP